MTDLTIVEQNRWLPTSEHGTHVVLRGEQIAYGPGTYDECEEYVAAWTQTEEAYERASSDVVLSLSRDEANGIAEALTQLAGIESALDRARAITGRASEDRLDPDELLRLRDLIL